MLIGSSYSHFKHYAYALVPQISKRAVNANGEHTEAYRYLIRN